MRRFTRESDRREFLRKCGALLTGSTAFGVAGRLSDIDWLIDADTATQLGLDPPQFMENYPDSFFVARDGRHNYIVGYSNDFRERWRRAHRHCMIERPRDKARRIRIFRRYLYGEL